MKRSLIPATLISSFCLISLLSTSFGKEEINKETILSENSELGEFDKPITLNPKQFKNYDQVEYEQKEYIRKHYEDYEVFGNSYIMDEGHFLFGFLLKNDKGEIKTVYFDMTDIYKKFEGNHKYRNIIKKLKEQYPPQPAI